MKKILIVCAAALLAIPVLAQVKSSVIKNTADTEVFSIGYGSGVATVTVAGVVSATSIRSTTPSIAATGSASFNTVTATNSAVGLTVSGSATVGGSLTAGTFVSSPYYQVVGEGQTGRLDVVVVTGAYNLVYIVGNTTNTVAEDVK